jgi:hypothetical protein
MIRSNIGLSGLSSVCHVPDNVRASEYEGRRAPCQVCHTFVNK